MERGGGMEREISCCFTGRRPDKLPWGDCETDIRCLDLKKRLEKALRQAVSDGYRHFISGMARGTDLYFAEAVLYLQKEYPEITLEAARPCESQADTWPEKEKRRYHWILSQCNYETLVQYTYDRGCMMRRNRYMVDHSNRVIAVYDGVPSGGTAQTLAYALKQGLEAEILEVV